MFMTDVNDIIYDTLRDWEGIRIQSIHYGWNDRTVDKIALWFKGIIQIQSAFGWNSFDYPKYLSLNILIILVKFKLSRYK